MFNAAIGEKIRALRENAGFTQSNLAAFMKVDQSLISKIEKGEGSLSADMLEKLADLFGVTVAQMESRNMATPKNSFPFWGSELTVDEMEAISENSRIAINLDFMRAILNENRENKECIRKQKSSKRITDCAFLYLGRRSFPLRERHLGETTTIIFL